MRILPFKSKGICASKSDERKVIGRFRIETRLVFRIEDSLQGIGNLPGQLRLHREYIFEFSIVILGPEGLVGTGLDQLRG